MKKIFLYLYPIQEYNRSFEFSEEYLYEIGRDNPYKVLNECIQKDIGKRNMKLFMQFIQVKKFMELKL